MRAKESGLARHRSRTGGRAGVTPAPPPAANSAPEPSARPAPAPAQALAAGPGTGSRPPCVSGPPAGARRTCRAGSAAGARRASAFSAVQGSAQSVPGNSDAHWARFVFRGPFGPRATGRATEKAAGIWKTPAAYIGRRPGVLGPERAAFIRELEEALCPDRPSPVKITQEDVKVMLNLLEEILHLRHQVSLRDDLLQLYSDSEEEQEEEEEEEEEEEKEEEEEEEEEEEQQHEHSFGAPEPTSLWETESLHSCPQQTALQEQLRLLEEENAQLRLEASYLDTLEEEEQMLILDCVEQFSESSQQMAELSEVLALRMGNQDQQQREVTQLRAQVLKLQQRCQSYGAETEKLQQQLALERVIQMQLQDEDLQEKYTEDGGMLIQAWEEVKTLLQQTPGSTGPVTHSTYAVPLEALPGFQETLDEELRRSIRRIISDPVFFMERNHGTTEKEVSHLGYRLCCSEVREQDQGLEAEKGLLTAEDFVPVEELVPEEELGAAEVPASAEEGATEEAELVSEEAKAWKEVEPELNEATQRDMVTSALQASGLGPSRLNMKRVLQQLANWQDVCYSRQLRQKMLRKGIALSQQPEEAPQTA